MRGGNQGLASQLDLGFVQVLNNSGIDEKDFFAGLEEATKAGIEQQLPPGQIHSIKDLMLPAIARVGLITPTARKKYDAAGIPIFEDARVLEAMEGGTPQVMAAAE